MPGLPRYLAKRNPAEPGTYVIVDRATRHIVHLAYDVETEGVYESYFQALIDANKINARWQEEQALERLEQRLLDQEYQAHLEADA